MQSLRPVPNTSESPAATPTQHHPPPRPCMAAGLSTPPPKSYGTGADSWCHPFGTSTLGHPHVPCHPRLCPPPPRSVPRRERCPCPHSRGDAGRRAGTGSKGMGKATGRCPHGLEKVVGVSVCPPPPALSPQSHPQTSATAAVPQPRGSQPHPKLRLRVTKVPLCPLCWVGGETRPRHISPPPPGAFRAPHCPPPFILPPKSQQT